jgi:hypothetical protein
MVSAPNLKAIPTSKESIIYIVTGVANPDTIEYLQIQIFH